MTKELQAAGEGYSLDNYQTEKDVTNALVNLERAKEELQQFNDGHREYESTQRRRNNQRGEKDCMRRAGRHCFGPN
jgi:cell fate (sporulation/competence/biofilm development) regulator YlbF (YheA/YmcA/DUF963 family)